MKRIIDGKTYNTETAEEIASYSSPHYPNDFKRYDETLYKIKRGSWFVAGEGGPMTGYARLVGDGYSGGEGLRVLSPEEAME